MLSFSINHMSVAKLRYDAVIEMAASLGCVGVELRNDLPGDLFDGDSPNTVKDTLSQHGLRLLALAEVKSFNDWSDAKQKMAESLIYTAAKCGAEAVALIPRNDGTGLGNGERQANLRVALRELKPMLDEHELIGLVEPLGFEQCSLRSKEEAVDAIVSLNATDTFKLVHDTFHHTLAGAGPVFAEHTGIVHVSGVTDSHLAVDQMADKHRVFVDVNDRLNNIQQVNQLRQDGYTGAISMEAFSPDVHALTDPAAALSQSFSFILKQYDIYAA